MRLNSSARNASNTVLQPSSLCSQFFSFLMVLLCDRLPRARAFSAVLAFRSSRFMIASGPAE
jgi:hypothetical protein